MKNISASEGITPDRISLNGEEYIRADLVAHHVAGPVRDMPAVHYLDGTGKGRKRDAAEGH